MQFFLTIMLIVLLASLISLLLVRVARNLSPITTTRPLDNTLGTKIVTKYSLFLFLFFLFLFYFYFYSLFLFLFFLLLFIFIFIFLFLYFYILFIFSVGQDVQFLKFFQVKTVEICTSCPPLIYFLFLYKILFLFNLIYLFLFIFRFSVLFVINWLLIEENILITTTTHFAKNVIKQTQWKTCCQQKHWKHLTFWKSWMRIILHLLRHQK